jgi:transposase-like protein
MLTKQWSTLKPKVTGEGARAQFYALVIVDTSFTLARGYCEIMPNRSKRTLLPIIARVVRSYSNIYSDVWAAYKDLPLLNFDLKQVCHKYNFVHAQHVESFNNKLKIKKKKIKELGNRITLIFLLSLCGLGKFELDILQVDRVIKNRLRQISFLNYFFIFICCTNLF